MTAIVRKADGSVDVFGNATTVAPVGEGWRVRHRDGAERLVEKTYAAGEWLSVNCDARAPIDPATYPADAKVIGW